MATENDQNEIKQQSDEPANQTTSMRCVSGPPQCRHSPAFWEDVTEKLKNDTDSIKSLIKDGKIMMNDVSERGHTLLEYAAYWGNYQITQLCINLGTNLYHKDMYKQDALFWAKEGESHHIEQLLLLSQMEANICDRVNHISQSINRQQGIAQNMINELTSIGTQSKQLYNNISMELIIGLIQKKLVFSDDLLCLCWKTLEGNPLESELWKSISKTCQSIIQNNNKRDWFWLKHCVLPSNIWYTNMYGVEGKYLYYELLRLVRDESQMQLQKLEMKLKSKAAKDESVWQTLVKWDVDTHKLMKLNDNTSIARQDNISNGIQSEYLEHELNESATNASFDGSKFYDHHQYLSKLTLLAQIVDDSFHRSIQQLFSVNHQTQVGQIMDDSTNKTHDIVYVRGPVKLLKRARAKSETDYFGTMYPTSASVLDFNRCSLIFSDINSLLFAMQWFINKVNQKQSGSIIGVVRIKNGFKQYIEQTQYADIKMNVIIKGDNNNIIGEMQFLLQDMVAYKHNAHNLYSIEREEEFVSNSLGKILPSLLDKDKQHKICAAMGDIKGLCEYMVFNNKSEKEVVIVGNNDKHSILAPICKAGKHSAFKFVEALINNDELFTDHLFYEHNDETPIECAVRNNHFLIIRDVFHRKRVKERYTSSIRLLYRLIYWLFKDCRKIQMLQYVLDLLSLSESQLLEIMNYKYTDTESIYYKETIMVETVRFNTPNILRKLASILPETLFIDKVFEGDSENVNGLETAMRRNKLSHCKYLLSFQGIKDRCKDENNLDLIWRILYHSFAECTDDTVLDFVLKELEISKEVIAGCMTYNCVKPGEALKKLNKNALQYHKWNIIGRIICENTLERLKKLEMIIGEKLLIECVMISDGDNMNSVEHAICKNKKDIVQYLMSFNEVKQNILNKKQLIWRIVYWMSKEYNELMVQYLIPMLALNEKQLNELQSFQYPNESDDAHLNTYSDKKISNEHLNKLLNAMI